MVRMTEVEFLGACLAAYATNGVFGRGMWYEDAGVDRPVCINGKLNWLYETDNLNSPLAGKGLGPAENDRMMRDAGVEELEPDKFFQLVDATYGLKIVGR